MSVKNPSIPNRKKVRKFIKDVEEKKVERVQQKVFFQKPRQEWTSKASGQQCDAGFILHDLDTSFDEISYIELAAEGLAYSSC